ncbi:GMC family oxidoreductase [Niastella koreensis]|uniref:Fumarate reductase/succinate dehydrogenase flavoprotein domain protein n=2 Tax=Niastella koreensis TaxID=354356 RepID=G8TR50_NIAKG|nr:GMC family oxidoreductase [Niastella koreensis]AEV98964.1 fumarate reductase/succinate dehydrogenase flavoprotein domain protein [Niastella koreensis GR20-10]OQP43886.1 GMC family oxidoreductase [Niastella koreensis]
MGDLQVKKNARQYDAIIVGSGAGGGMAAYVLSHAGLKVCLIEAGPMYDPRKNVTQFKNPWESPRRGASTKFRPFGDFDACYWGWEIDGEPYTHAENTKWEWWRARMIGGRTNHWGRISLRFGPKDFKRHSIDGMGDDWPIGYDDVKPYYDKVDRLIGVFGSNEGLENDPDGIFLPPPKPRLHELMIKKAASGVGVPVIPSRLSILTKKINDSRGECIFCGQCNRACSIAYADFSSSSVLVKPALETGNVDVITNAMAREVLTNNEGLATGVSYVNKMDLQEYQVMGRTVILAASACESARLLLNSKSARYPTGLANSSGVVGKYLHDSTGADMGGVLPELFDRKRYNEDGVGGAHIYSPWFGDNKKLDFPRGYHIEYWGGFGQPAYGFGNSVQALNGRFEVKGKQKQPGGYGSSLKEDMRFFYGARVGMAGRGEALAVKENLCEIDPKVVDKYGIPVLRFKVEPHKYDILQAKHMKETFKEIMHAMGAIITYGGDDDEKNNYGLHAPGNIIHEAGTVRMGNDPRESVLNKYNQAHDVKNLFCVDGGPFVSQADKNITWTILALSMRASEYIIDEMKKKNL